MKYLMAVFWMTLLLGCNDPDNKWYDCTDERLPSIILNLFDAETDLPIADNQSAIQIRVNTIDTMKVIAYTQIANEAVAYGIAAPAFVEVAGTFTIEIIKPGYQDTTLSNILVTENNCHVNTKSISLYLNREAP